MPFCKYCGSKLDDDSRFCSKCGNPVNYPEQSREAPNDKNRSEAGMGKCPNCGGLIKSFSASCEYCGYEFINRSDSLKIAEFESEFHKARTLNQKISLIQSLPISNSKESLLEVFYLASANVGNDIARSEKAEIKIQQAWKSKFEQAYLKAGMILRDDPELVRVEKIYSEKNKKKSFWKSML